MPGERNPQSAAQEFAPPPQGESVLDASMMAELIVTKKEIGPQLKKSAGTSRARPKSPGAGGQRLPLAGRLRAERWILWFLGLGALLAAWFAVSTWTQVEGKIEADTAAWKQLIQGHSHDRRHAKRQRSGHAGPDMACRASVICTDEDAHPRHVLRALGRSPEGAKWNGGKQPASDSADPPGRDMAGCHCNEG